MQPTLRAILVAAGFGAVTGGFLGAGVSPVLAQNASAIVAIDNFTFNPQRLTIKSGTTVTWKNGDDIPHAIASASRLFKSQPLDTGDTYSFTFTTPGTYEYFCSLHPHMTGTIMVEARTGSDAAR